MRRNEVRHLGELEHERPDLDRLGGLVLLHVVGVVEELGTVDEPKMVRIRSAAVGGSRRRGFLSPCSSARGE